MLLLLRIGTQLHYLLLLCVQFGLFIPCFAKQQRMHLHSHMLKRIIFPSSSFHFPGTAMTVSWITDKRVSSVVHITDPSGNVNVVKAKDAAAT